jgi:hypothetical protein
MHGWFRGVRRDREVLKDVVERIGTMMMMLMMMVKKKKKSGEGLL